MADIVSGVAVFALRARRHYRGEEHWFPLLEELGHRRLRAALIDAGLSPQRASGVVFFLDDQRHLDRHQGEASRTRYRAALAELEPADVRRRARVRAALEERPALELEAELA